MRFTPRRWGGVLAVVGFVAASLAWPIASLPAAAQQAVLTCPPNFGPLVLEPGQPQSTFTDGVGGSTCAYRNPDDADEDLILSVSWVESQERAIEPRLCGEPRVDRHLGQGTPPSEASSIEIPSATSVARLYLAGSHLDDEANWPPAEELAREYLAQVERTALPLPCPGVATTSKGCTVIVRDALGGPVPDVRILLEGAGEARKGATDATGKAVFADVPVGKRVKATAVLEDAAHTPSWFDITEDGFTMSASSTSRTVGGEEACVLRVYASKQDTIVSERPGPERWPDAVDIFRNTRNALRLAEQLGPPAYLPLHVHAFCTLPALGCADPDGKAPGAFAVVGHPGKAEANPYVALLARFSGRDDPSRPDNREFHEVGHWYQASLMGGQVPSDCPTTRACGHDGYYVNRSSTGAWVEGFASFYAVMVNKHVTLRPYPELYRMYGTNWNLERDQLAWAAAGKLEEFALTGILLDLEDGPGDYEKPAQPAPTLRVTCCTTAGGIATGYVENEGSNKNGRAARDVRVTVTLPDGSTKEVTTVPGDIPGGEFGRFAFAVPDGTSGTAIGTIARLGRQATGSDDDAVTVPLAEIMATIRDNPGTRGLPVSDVQELHDVAKAAWGGDRDGNGLDDVDEIFIAHGFFDDSAAPLETWQPGDAVGPSSHQGNHLFPALVPRRQAELPDALGVVVDIGGTDATFLVDVAVPEGTEEVSTVTEVEPDADGRVLFDLPREGSGATITILAMADGRAPVVAGRLAADDVWAHADDAPDETAARFGADVASAPTWDPGGGAGSSSRTPLIIGGALAAVVVVGLLLFSAARRGRGRASAIPTLAAPITSAPPLAPPPHRPSTLARPPARPPIVAPPPQRPPPQAPRAPSSSAPPSPRPPSAPPPGWYPDPHRRHDLRWWDGTRWTPHAFTAGRAFEDPG